MTFQVEQISRKKKKSRYPNTNNLGLHHRSKTNLSMDVCEAACYVHSEKLDTMFREWYAYHSSHHCTCPGSCSDLSRWSSPWRWTTRIGPRKSFWSECWGPGARLTTKLSWQWIPLWAKEASDPRLRALRARECNNSLSLSYGSLLAKVPRVGKGLGTPTPWQRRLSRE